MWRSYRNAAEVPICLAAGMGRLNMESIKDELSGLRQLLAGLESGGMHISRNGVDISKEQIAVLKQEIANLDAFLAKHRHA
jgi:hypothetical protein